MVKVRVLLEVSRLLPLLPWSQNTLSSHSGSSSVITHSQNLLFSRISYEERRLSFGQLMKVTLRNRCFTGQGLDMYFFGFEANFHRQWIFFYYYYSLATRSAGSNLSAVKHFDKTMPPSRGLPLRSIVGTAIPTPRLLNGIRFSHRLVRTQCAHWNYQDHVLISVI